MGDYYDTGSYLKCVTLRVISNRGNSPFPMSSMSSMSDNTQGNTMEVKKKRRSRGGERK